MRINYDRQELIALYEISKILGSSLNLRSNMKHTMLILSEYLDMKRATVALKNEEEVVMVASYGLSDEEMRRGRYRIGEGIIGKVAKLGTPVVIPSLGSEPLFLNKTRSRKDIDKKNISFICVPIKYKSEVLGVLSVDRLFAVKGRAFEDDLRLLNIIASLLAQHIQLNRRVNDEKNALLQQTEELKKTLEGRFRIANMIGQSDRMLDVFESVSRVASSKASVLLMGESGTGKELVARAIHYNSPRSKAPFIKFNCASIPEGLLESELFGHEKGAFTGATAVRKGRFELAHGGTIFLDEIGDLPAGLQPKILRVLQEREFERVGGEKTIKVDIRLVAATSRDLEALVKTGQFRDDLYYRLNVVPVLMPPLRERREDIPLLVEHFLKKFNKENSRNTVIDAPVLKLLSAYDWPGNVRELENTIERLVVMTRGSTITADELPLAVKSGTMKHPLSATTGEALTAALEDIEKARLAEALEKTDWNQAKASRLLGITPRQIGYKIQKYKLARP